MITREQARQIAVAAQQRGLSREQTAALIQRANERATQTAQPQGQPTQTSTTEIAPPSRPLLARIADGLDTVQAAGNAFTNTLTLGSLDRINAGIDNLTGVDSTVASNRAQRQALAQSNPTANALGTAAGVLVPALATGGASLGKDAARVTGAKVAATGALQGLAFDPASDENTDFLQPAQRLQNAAVGAVGGAALQRAGRALGGLKNRAGELAVKFLKPTSKQGREIAARFGSASNFGQALLDSGSFKGSVTGGRAKVLDNLVQLEGATGKAIPEALNKITQAAKKAKVPAKETTINLKDVIAKTKRQFKDSSVFDTRGSNIRLDRELNNITKSAGLRARKGLIDANDLRKQGAKELFENKSILTQGSQKDQIRRAFNSNLKEAIDKKADRLATRIFNAPGGFTKAKSRFAKTTEARKIIQDTVEKSAGQNSIGLRQAGVGGAGLLATGQQALAGDAEGAATAGLGTLAATALLSPNATAARAQLFNQLGNRFGGRVAQSLQSPEAISALNRLLLTD